MNIVSIPALTDNYIWLLHDDHASALIVDPSASAPVETVLTTLGLRLKAILITHHHLDHTAGAKALRDRLDVPVYAPQDRRIEAATHRVTNGDELYFVAPAVKFRVLAVPGHTLSHVAYAGEGLLFCGDTLFSLGCGRLFEGSPEQMLASLDRLAALPDATQVCCAHEYTAANARFAALVTPENTALALRTRQVAALRAAGKPTLPVLLAGEKATNPFLRVDHTEVIDWCARQGVATESRTVRFAALRKAKDVFS